LKEWQEAVILGIKAGKSRKAPSLAFLLYNLTPEMGFSTKTATWRGYRLRVKIEGK
jgi:hypothetical protein